ncbi:hypothetical protein [Bradyrhizobium genomosp. III]|uniref:hypothetical protein n=1 Tax=Bradyrhizobium genomosp. III TaxID=2683271 RepID=UPI0004AD7418|nr:hypothetical protein [Bradyrhizobium sp. CCBAU 15615]
MGRSGTSTAKIAFGRIERGLKRRKIVNHTEMTITVGNGAVLRFKSAEKPDNLYGEDVWVL